MHSSYKPKGDHLASVNQFLSLGQQPWSSEFFSCSHKEFHCLDFVFRRINYSILDSAHQLRVSFLAVPIPFEVFWALLFQVFLNLVYCVCGFFLEGSVQGGVGFLHQGLVADSFLFLIDFWLSLVELKEVAEVEQAAQWCSMGKKKSS